MSFLPTGRITQAWHVATSPPSSRLSLRATMIHTHYLTYLQVCAPPRRQPPSTNRSRRPLSVMSSRPSSTHGGQRFAVETRDIRMRLRPTALHGVLALHHPPPKSQQERDAKQHSGEVMLLFLAAAMDQSGCFVRAKPPLEDAPRTAAAVRQAGGQ